MYINYREILEEAWEILVKKRFLWPFGLFIVASTFWMDIPFQFLPHELPLKNSSVLLGLSRLSMSMVVIGVAILYLLRLLSLAALIKSLSNLHIYSRYSYRQIFNIARNYLLSLIYLEILTVFFALILTISIGLPMSKVMNYGALQATVAFIAGIFLIAVLLSAGFFIRKYASYYIILGNEHVYASIKGAWISFGRNIWKSIAFALMSLVIIVAYQIVVLSFVTFLVGTLFLIVSKLYGIFFIASRYLIAGFAISMMLFFAAVLEVFMQAAWLRFFQGINSAKSDEKAEVKSVQLEVPSVKTI